MTTESTTPNVAVFCDFENVAIGVRDARYDAFDIDLVLARILDKGKIVFKKAYADWDRFKSAKRSMHEASFELVEIPHVSYSGKNSADIRLVVDALDLSYTKNHVDVFVIVSGDSDFSPLVSKLRENDKVVIGLGVKNSSSDLLIENCDEFIYYDDLVRHKRSARGAKKSSRRGGRGRGRGGRSEATEAEAPKARDEAKDGTKDAPKAPKQAETPSAAEESGDPQEALELVLDTVESLFADRDGNLWGSMVKQVIKRKRPQFSESYFGYRSFNQLLEDAAKAELLDVVLDEKSGNYVIQGFGPKA
ncbi:MAG: NYN domain-containing protein [Myxococcota bacterium]